MTGQSQIWLFRHGETEWSRTGQHTGRTDLPLTAAGRHRAEAIGRRLAGRPFALVLSSPVARALKTCRLAGYSNVIALADDLREWDYGAYEGRRTVDIQEERPGWSLWRDGVPDGETIEQVAARARKVIAAVEAAAGDVALFAHGHILRVLIACWLDLPSTAGRLFVLGTAAVSVRLRAGDARHRQVEPGQPPRRLEEDMKIPALADADTVVGQGGRARRSGARGRREVPASQRESRALTSRRMSMKRSTRSPRCDRVRVTAVGRLIR
jgi:probable phosphoglycerate mutase